MTPDANLFNKILENQAHQHIKISNAMNKWALLLEHNDDSVYENQAK